MSSHDRTSSYVELLSSGKMSPPGKTSPGEMSSGGLLGELEAWCMQSRTCLLSREGRLEDWIKSRGCSSSNIEISRRFSVCSSKSSASPVLSNCEADVNDGGKEETCSTNDVRRMGKCEK